MLGAGAAAQETGRRPQVYVLDGRVFVYDAASAAALLSEHRIWVTPVGVRRARNKSPPYSFPCVLSQEQATVVLERHLADVTYRSRSLEGGYDHPKPLQEKDGGVAGAEQREKGKIGSTTTTKKACLSPRLGFEWRFPGTAAEKKSMAVFEDLWAKGLCAVSGSNYGADFVVYDGPPTERHSVAAVMVSRGANDELSPAEVSGFTRVQQAVGKRAVIATPPLLVENTAPAVVGTRKSAATGVASLDDEFGPSGVEGRENSPGRYNGGGETASSTTSATTSTVPAAAAANGCVRYITLRFYSVSSRA